MSKALFCFLICLLGSDKESQNYTSIPDGIYAGTFQRELAWAENDKAAITIAFTSNTWSASSDKIKYPALCKVTYSIVMTHYNENYPEIV